MTPDEVVPSEGQPVRRDGFLAGRLALWQPARGHRAGTDAVLLAAGVRAGEGERVVDLGAGAGQAGLAVAVLNPGCRVDLVELDPGMARLAEANVAGNGLAGRVRVAQTDLTRARERMAAGLPPGGATWVIANPPFLPAGTVRASPLPQRRLAHGEAEGDEGMLAAWLRAAASLLAEGGTLVLIHRADALPRLLAGLAGRFGDVRLRPVLPHRDRAAHRVLARATRGSRAPLCLLPPLVLHGADGRFTPEVDRLHRGEAWLAWDTEGPVLRPECPSGAVIAQEPPGVA